LKNLKFPSGYTIGFRRAMNLELAKLNGVKSNDYHIFMERLLPVMFHGYLEEEIPLLICKLEKIFPLGWFNPMQHLLVHLPYGAKLCGPQQYRWMYHIERALKNLRAMVHNKAKVEGCIVE
jgi:hypothetical protein